MKVPNVDGNYKTRDGSLVVIVTRSTITIDLVKSKETEYHDTPLFCVDAEKLREAGERVPMFEL